MQRGIILIAITVAACRPGAPSRPAAEKPLVRLELVAGATHVAPGEPIELAALFTLAPGWHIYWINPGESGLATRVAITAPDFPAAPVEYPGPTSFRTANVINYGYEHETALFVRPVAPPELAPGASVTFTARASWLVCREECIPGDAVATLTLSVGDSRASADPGRRLAPHRARLPSPEHPPGLTHEWREDDRTRTLALALPGADTIEFFPLVDQPALYRDQELTDDGRLLVNFVRNGSPATNTVTGVLRVVDGGAARYYSLSIPWLSDGGAP